MTACRRRRRASCVVRRALIGCVHSKCCVLCWAVNAAAVGEGFMLCVCGVHGTTITLLCLVYTTRARVPVTRREERCRRCERKCARVRRWIYNSQCLVKARTRARKNVEFLRWVGRRGGDFVDILFICVTGGLFCWCAGRVFPFVRCELLCYNFHRLDK